MRKAMLFLAVLGLVGSLYAADPWLGTWKLNVAKSKFTPIRPAPKEETCVVRQVGDHLEVTFTGKRIDGSPISFKGTRPKQGGAVEMQPSPAGGLSFIEAVIEPGNWYLVGLQNGKRVYLDHSVVSKDRKTGYSTIRGTDENGKPYESILVWEKQ